MRACQRSRLANFDRSEDFQLRKAIAAKLNIFKIAHRIVEAKVEIEHVVVEVISESNLLHAKLDGALAHGDHRRLAIKAVIRVNVIVAKIHSKAL